MTNTVGYVSLKDVTPERFADLIREKLRRA
jgi:hypothetical protein